MMAADAFANANSTHTVGSPHGAQVGKRMSSYNGAAFGSPSQPPTSDSSLSSAAAVVLGLSNLSRTDPTFSGGPSLQAIPFANSVGQDNSMEEDKTDGNSGGSSASVAHKRISKQEDIVRPLLVIASFNLFTVLRSSNKD